MKLSETAIRRPVLASMISAALVLFGVIGYARLSVRELPDIDPPIISVSTTCALAPGSVVLTEMIGGSMSGSSRTERRVYPMTPNNTSAPESMLASTGR